MDVVVFAACIVVAFLVGGIPFGFAIAKAKGIDIRKIGSGNIGATNVGRALGRKYAILVFFLDAAKGAVPVLLVRFVIPLDGGVELLAALTAAAAICGHIFSPFLWFRGGKGTATGAGATAALLPLPFLICASVWALVFVLMRYVSLASITSAVALPVSFLLINIKNPDILGSEVVPFVYSLVIASLIVVSHRSNIGRLVRGEEPKVGRRKDSAG